MNKETKFRAWSLEGELKMLYVNELSWKKHENGAVYVHFTGSTEFGEHSFEVHSGFGRVDCSGPMVWRLMQFIGFQDEDKNDIYEDDIVLVDRYDTHELYQCVVEDIRRIPDIMFGSSVNSIKVIGNKWQNPELLEWPENQKKI